MMRLSDVISRISNSPTILSIALVLFFLVFLGVIFYAYVFLSRESIDKLSAMPLDDYVPVEPRENGPKSVTTTE